METPERHGARLIPVNGADHALHGALALVGILAALASSPNVARSGSWKPTSGG